MQDFALGGGIPSPLPSPPLSLKIGSPLNQQGVLGEHCKLPERGPGPQMNLLHSNAVSILKCMFYSKTIKIKIEQKKFKIVKQYRIVQRKM